MPHTVQPKLSRRQALAVGTASVALTSCATSARQNADHASVSPQHCLLTPQQIEGPYYFDPKLERRDIREDRTGIPLTLAIRVLAKNCEPAQNARVDIWHADRLGVYSGYPDQGDGLDIDMTGRTYLRGTQFTDSDGRVEFETIYPGWYRGRTTHIHAKIYLDRSTVLTSQMYFPDALSEFIYQNTPCYMRREIRDRINANDRRLKEAEGLGFLSIAEGSDGYSAEQVFRIDPMARPPQGTEQFPPGAPPKGPVLSPEDRIKLLVPGS